MKAQVMKKAWELFKRETRRTVSLKTVSFWSSCLRIAWALVKGEQQPKQENKRFFFGGNKQQQKQDDFFGKFWWYRTSVKMVMMCLFATIPRPTTLKKLVNGTLFQK